MLGVKECVPTVRKASKHQNDSRKVQNWSGN